MARTWLPVAISYVLDWIVVILVAVAGGVLNYISGYHRPFSLTDMSIAYPDNDDIISVPVLIVVSLIVPAGIIFVLCIASNLLGNTSYSIHAVRWLQVLWEVHTGVIGLCASLASALFITSGLKDVVGKPRPHLLAVCNADLSQLLTFRVGGLGDSINSESVALVSSGICQQPDKHTLDDAFSAFPSGHSSFACAGLIYLSLWLCGRYSLSIPYLSPLRKPTDSKEPDTRAQSAPPLWQLATALLPTVVALFICATRYADFHHAGWDISAGAVIGTVFAFSAFRLYHLPIRRSRGLLAWGERARRHAFFSSPAKYEEGNAEATHANGLGDNYELRQTSDIERPERVDTNNSERPMMNGQHAGH